MRRRRVRAHFQSALTGAELVERIEVRWPSGAQQVIEDPIATDEPIEITEPSRRAPG